MVKKLKHILIIYFYFFSAMSLYAKADIYLATGILTSERSTDIAVKALKEDLKASNPEVYGSQAFKSAYNTSHGFWDLIEAAGQLLNQNGWSQYWNSFLDITFMQVNSYYIDYFAGLTKNHTIDLSEQIKNYKASIDAGNQVIVIAHSQGNYFTNEAYAALNDCQKKSFYMLGTANPASSVSGEKEGRGALATLDNDPITYVPSSMSPNIINNERYIVGNVLTKVDVKHYKFHFFDYYQYGNDVTKGKIDYFPEYAINHYKTKMNDIAAVGPAEVTLGWESPSVNMDLRVDWSAGFMDVKNICSSVEHFVVKDKDSIEVGEYPVYIAYLGGAEEEDFPQKVNLKISALNASKTFSFNVTSFEGFDTLHVANIVITGDGEVEVKTSERLASAGGSGGSGSGGGGGSIGGTSSNSGPSSMSSFVDFNSSDGSEVMYRAEPSFNLIVQEKEISSENEEELYAEIVSQLDQAVAGPLSDAKIELFDLKAIDNNNSLIYEGRTLGGRSLLTGGVILLPNTIKDSLNDESLYLLQISGGDDLDFDDDGKTDVTPTPNYGKLRALLSGHEIKTGGLKVTILTEIAYQVTKKLLDSNSSQVINDHLDSVAKRVLNKSIDNNDDINKKDIFKWVPSQNKDILTREYTSIETMLLKVHNNEDIYDEAFAFVYLPFLPNALFSVNENALANSIVGKIEYEQKEEPLNTLMLSGTGSENFNIALDGTISVNENANINYEQNAVYYLYATASNAIGDYRSSVTIRVNNILDAPELEELVAHVSENADEGTIVGKISYNQGINEITLFELMGEGKENFHIDVNGTISVALGTQLDYESSQYYFNLQAVATNASGSSLPSKVIIYIDNILDNPELKSFTATLAENSPAGTVVGTLEFEEGTSAITSFELSLDGSENFHIDNNGVITVSPSASLDFEGVNHFRFKVVATNASGPSLPQAVNITLLNLPDIPMLSSLSISIDENIVVNSVLGAIPIVTEGDLNITKFTLSGSGRHLFDVSPKGIITLKDSSEIDFESVRQYTLSAIAINAIGESLPVDVIININNVMDAPTLYDTTLNIDEHSLGGTYVGKISISDHQDCAITAINSKYSNSNFVIDFDGTVRIAEDALIDYERRSYFWMRMQATTECGLSNEAELHINVNDLDENAETGIGTLVYSHVDIYLIEQNATLTNLYTEQVRTQKYGTTSNDYVGVFNTHKYELDAQRYYLFDVHDGQELDIDHNGILDWSNKVPFKGHLRAIVKGQWVKDIPRIRVTPVSELVTDFIEMQAEGFTPYSLEERLLDASQQIIRDDIDGNAEIDIFDSLVYNALNTFDAYVLVNDAQAVVKKDAAIGTEVTQLQIIPIHDGTLTSLELSGEDSEWFEIDIDGKLRVAGNLQNTTKINYVFTVKGIDINGIQSSAEVLITILPSMNIISSYDTSGYVSKTVLSSDNTKLFVATGEGGLVILDVSDPFSIELISDFGADLQLVHDIDINSVALSPDNKILYLTDKVQNKLIILDVSNPTVFNLKGEYIFERDNYKPQDLIVSLDGKFVYVIGRYSFDIIDVQDAENPEYASSLNDIDSGEGMLNISWKSDSEISLMMDYFEEVRRIDVNIADPYKPYQTDDIYQSYVTRLISSNRLLGYELDHWSNLYVYNFGKLDEWGNAEKIMELKTPGNTNDMLLSADEKYLFISDGEAGVQIVALFANN